VVSEPKCEPLFSLLYFYLSGLIIATVPDRRRFGHVYVICSCYAACVDGKGEKGGQSKGLKMGQLTLSIGPAKVEVRFFVQRTTITSKRVLFFTLLSATYH
jgi:hypothetical protein